MSAVEVNVDTTENEALSIEDSGKDLIFPNSELGPLPPELQISSTILFLVRSCVIGLLTGLAIWLFKSSIAQVATW